MLKQENVRYGMVNFCLNNKRGLTLQGKLKLEG